MRLSSLTLALTAFNEEDVLADTVERALEALPKLANDFELLIIDDGSADRTARIALSLTKKHPHVRLIQHSENRGMGAAIQTAIENASKDWFCTIAADGQVNPNDLQAFLANAKEFDAVFSTYSTRRDGLDRWILSSGVRILLYLFTGNWRIPTGNYFIRRQVVQQLQLRSNSFVVNYEVFLEVKRQGHSMNWTELPCHVRSSGSSRIRNLKTIWKVFREIVSYRLR